MPAKMAPGPANYLAPFGLTYRHYWQLRIDPIGFATRLARQHGDLTRFQIFWHRTFLVNHPDLIRQVLVSDVDKYPKFDRITNQLKQATGDGLLVAEGEHWRKQRLAGQKIFRSDRIKVFNRLGSIYTDAMLTRWRDKPHVNIEYEMTLLTQAIMGKGFFGMELRPGHRIAEAARVYSDVFHHESRALFCLPDWMPLPFKKKKRDSITLLRRSLANVVKERILSGNRHDDFLDMLLHANDGPLRQLEDGDSPSAPIDRVVDHLLTMYVAGFHTTSVSLAWLFYLVAKHEEIQQRLRREINEVCGDESPHSDHLERLAYAQMVIKESLRLYPAAWELFARRSNCDSELGGYRVPAGSLLLIMPIVTHRDPRFFPNPEQFDPRRFSPEREQQIAPGAYLPFGAGPRQCIGKSLALQQMSHILATVLQNFEVRLDEENPAEIPVCPRVSLRPANDIRIMLRPVRTRKTSSSKLAGTTT